MRPIEGDVVPVPWQSQSEGRLQVMSLGRSQSYGSRSSQPLSVHSCPPAPGERDLCGLHRVMGYQAGAGVLAGQAQSLEALSVV